MDIRLFQEYSKIESFRRQPMDTQSVLMQLNIADDYFKAKKQIGILEEELQAKEKELYDLKHELIASHPPLPQTIVKNGKPLWRYTKYTALYYAAIPSTLYIRMELQAKEKELYDLKHELIASQIKLENTEKRTKELQMEINENAKRIVRLETELKIQRRKHLPNQQKRAHILYDGAVKPRFIKRRKVIRQSGKFLVL